MDTRLSSLAPLDADVQSTPDPSPGLAARILQAIALLALLYLFLLGISLLGESFKLLGGSEVGSLLASVRHPISALMIGMIATALLQSSSTTTSIVVGLVAGGALPLEVAIPMVMGANIGTSVTNTLVSLGHAGNRAEFGRAFAGATIHDIFNILAVLILLPLEVTLGLIQRLSATITGWLAGSNGATFDSPLKAILKPAVSSIVTVDASRIEAGAIEGSLLSGGVFHGHGLSDHAAGLSVALGAALLTILALLGIVKLLKAVTHARSATWLKNALHKNAWASMGIGAGATAVVQSSSVTTSTLVPMVGVGMVSLEAVFPLTLGANLGTTVTALLAAMAVTGDHAALGLQIALCHLLFNVLGVLIWYPLPWLRQIPLTVARKLGDLVARQRLMALVYIALVFFILPLSILGIDDLLDRAL